MEALYPLLESYGALLLLAVTVIAAFGLPAPASLSLVAAGACSRAGVLDPAAVLAAGLAGTVLGDHLAYLTGRRAAALLEGGRWQPRLDRARRGLERWGVVHVFVSRFVFPTVLTPATNYIAGISRFPVRRFAPAVVLGEAVYVLLYCALGWTFSAQVLQANAMAATASLLLLILILAGYFMVMIVQGFRR